MSFGSEIFQGLNLDNAKGRAQRKKTDEKYLHKPLPPSSLRFYNDAFKKVDRTVQKLLRKYNLSSRSLELAKSAYGVRVGKGATFGDLLKMDVFQLKTYNQDLLPDDAFGGFRRRERQLSASFLAYHFFLHRPQRTEHILFHEIVVGYLVHAITGGRQSLRHELPLKSPEGYLSIVNYLVERLAKLNHLSPGQLVALHLEDRKTVNAILSPCTKELMLAGAELYWYLDFFARWARKYSPADALEFIYNFFLLPFVERELDEPGWRLRSDASRRIDEAFNATLFKHYPNYGKGFGDPEVARTVCKCFEVVWYRPRGG